MRFDSTLTVHTVEHEVLLEEEEDTEVETTSAINFVSDSKIPQSSEDMECEDAKDPDSSQAYRGNPNVDGGDGADTHEGEESSFGLTAKEREATSMLVEDLEGTVNFPDNAEASSDVAELTSCLEGADDEMVFHEVGSKLAAAAVQGAVQRMTSPQI